MKIRILILFFFTTLIVFAQAPNSEEKIKELKVKVSQTIAGEKLTWMDSLSKVIVTETNYINDSIVRETVTYAMELDSIRVATWHIANLIYFQNNRAGDPKNGNDIFIDFLDNATQTNSNHALAKYYIEGADSYYFIEYFDESIRYFNIAEEYARKAKNSRLEGLAIRYKGGTLSFQGAFA